jgi:site-specific recombinase XerD
LTEASLIITQPDIELPDALQQRATILDAFENFFQGKLRNPNTRRAYEHSAEAFLKFVSAHYGIDRLDGIRPPHISGWLDAMTENGLSAPTVKQRLAALVTLFDSLVAQQILHRNPAKLVEGPSHVIHKGSTPVLSGDEMRQLLDAIDVTTLIGKRDIAMIGTMAYTFARISAVTALKVSHVFHQKGRLWLRLKDKGGKRQDIPCHHNLEAYLVQWLDAAGHRGTPDAPLFQTFATRGERTAEVQEEAHRGLDQEPIENNPKTARRLSGWAMTQATAWEMLQRRKKRAGLSTAICNHTFRATGITAYLSNGGGIERAAVIAGHASINTTKLYDRRPDDVTLDEIEKIRFA